MRLNRGDRIAGVDGLRLRRYFQRYGSEQMNYVTVMKEFSITKRQAEKMLADLLEVEMISRCEFQHDKKLVYYQTTIKGNALGMAKAGKPVKRASADDVLREFLDRVRAVNGRQELAHSVESVVVFGSYLSEAMRLNDLDIAVELKAKWHDDATFLELSHSEPGPGPREGATLPELGGRGWLAGARSAFYSEKSVANAQPLPIGFAFAHEELSLLRSVWRRGANCRFAQRRGGRRIANRTLRGVHPTPVRLDRLVAGTRGQASGP
jgi:hypothetical protein